MSNKNVQNVVFLCVCALVIFSIVIFASEKGSANQNTENIVTPPTSNAGSSKDTLPSYTAAEVAANNNASSCWTIVNNTVYDVTSFISQHPDGSEKILSICGIDGSSAFDTQHAGQPRPEQELSSLKIGILKK